MTESGEQIIKSIRHYQSNLDKYTASKNEQKVLHSIERLRKLPIKVSHLEETGVGRTVNSLRKLEGNIGEAARKLVSKWKNMVVQEQKEEEDNNDDDDDDDDDDNDDDEDDNGESTIEIESSSKHKKHHSLKDKTEKRKHSDEEEMLKEKKHKKHKKHHKSNDNEKSSSSKDKSHHHHHHKSSKQKSNKEDKNKHLKQEKKSIRNINNSKDGIDSASGTTFGEALGFCAPLINANKSIKKKNNEEKPGSSREKHDLPPVSPPTTQIDVNISNLLPTLTPNYRPLGHHIPSSLENTHKRPLSEDETLSRVIQSKNQRTKVYSGNKVIWGKVPTLFEICIRFLQDNIEYLEYTGGVPYAILKPVLEKANPDQLYLMEHHNPYLIEETDELWQLHCQREFRTKQREEMESWRDMYMRCLDEREAKLKTLTANIKQAQDKSLPVRTTKLAYVDDVVKPPRNIARKQIKNGIMFDNKRPQMTPASRLTALATAGEAGKIAVPNPGSRASEQRTSSSTILKPKKAPLMAKTLTLFKNRFRR